MMYKVGGASVLWLCFKMKLNAGATRWKLAWLYAWHKYIWCPSTHTLITHPPMYIAYIYIIIYYHLTVQEIKKWACYFLKTFGGYCNIVSAYGLKLWQLQWYSLYESFHLMPAGIEVIMNSELVHHHSLLFQSGDLWSGLKYIEYSISSCSICIQSLHWISHYSREQ